MTVAPSTVSLAPNARQTFTASGGSGTGFTWALASNASGGRIDATGNYTVGATGSVTDVVQATDSLGNSATATITVSAAPKGGGCSTAGSESAVTMFFAAMGVVARLTRRRRAS